MQNRLYRSTKLWSFYCDLEESLGTIESTKAVYNRILELRIASPQIILNFALFLQVHLQAIIQLLCYSLASWCKTFLIGSSHNVCYIRRNNFHLKSFTNFNFYQINELPSNVWQKSDYVQCVEYEVANWYPSFVLIWLQCWLDWISLVITKLKSESILGTCSDIYSVTKSIL